MILVPEPEMDDSTLSNPKETAKKEAFRAVLPDDEGSRLDRWIKRQFPAVTQGQIQKWLRTGQIRLDGKRVDSSTKIAAGQKIRLPPMLLNDDSLTVKPAASGKGRPVRNPDKLRALVLYEDEDIVVLNKPAGLAVQGGTGLKENLDDSLMALSRDGATKPKLVHRLDRETSGVLLIARSAFAATKLAQSFRTHETQKIYWAITRGVPPQDEGIIEAPLIKEGQKMRVATREDPKEAVKTAATLYKVIDQAGDKAAFVALWPLTGRTHQIRVHLQHLESPLWGDPIYDREGAENPFPEDAFGSGLHLHARRLILPHPRRGLIDVTAPLAPQMRKTFRWLRFNEKTETLFESPSRRRTKP